MTLARLAWPWGVLVFLVLLLGASSVYTRTLKAQRDLARVELVGMRAAFAAEQASTAAAADAARRCNVEATLTAGAYEKALRAARARLKTRVMGKTPADLEARFGAAFGPQRGGE